MDKFRGITRDDEEISKPYSGPDDPDLPANVRSLAANLRAIWVNVFNSAYSSCINDGGSQSECEGSAIAQAWGVVNAQEED